MSKLKVKKGDKVLVISGKDKGKSGEIVTVYPKNNRVKSGYVKNGAVKIVWYATLSLHNNEYSLVVISINYVIVIR